MYDDLNAIYEKYITFIYLNIIPKVETDINVCKYIYIHYTLIDNKVCFPS